MIMQKQSDCKMRISLNEKQLMSEFELVKLNNYMT